MTDIAADSDVIIGSSYLGEVDNVTATEGLFNGNAEIVINVMRSNLYWCIISSNNVDPYHWEATFSGATIGVKGWTPYVPGTRTIAGIDLKDNVTAAELQTALDDSTHRFVTDIEKSTWSGKQAALNTQTAYTSQGDATHVPQITTNSLGQVTGITEVAITQPTVNDATLTITQNGVSKGTFTANASSDNTIALTDTTYSSLSASQGGTDVSLVTTGEKYAWNAIYGVSGTTSLVAANWANGVYTLTVASLGAYDAIFFSPITSADKTAIEDADIIVSTNGTTVTFTAASTPTADVGLNYFVARGKA